MYQTPAQTLRARGQANQSAKWRGHKIEWRKVPHYSGIIWQGTCRKCQREVQVLQNPAPNDIVIGGEAVALNCR